jgi:hypothetical protein
MESHRFAEAKDELVEILRLDPFNSWALMLMGTIFAKRESNLPVAATYYAKAYALAPQDAYVLTNYAALKTEQGGTAEAQALDRMFSEAVFTDPRSQAVLEESRTLYLSLSAQVAELQSEQALKWVMEFSAHVAKEIGTPIEILSDDSLGSTSAKAGYDWDRQGQGHCIRFNPSAPAVVPALILREIERIRLKHQDRVAGIPEPVLKPTGRSFDDSLLEFALLAPEQARIDSELCDVPNEVLPALFVEMYLRADEQFRAYEAMKTQRGASADCFKIFELAAATTAFHLDYLFQPKTAYGQRHAKSACAPRARELAEEWSRQEEDFAGQRERFISETILSKHVTFQPPAT